MNASRRDALPTLAVGIAISADCAVILVAAFAAYDVFGTAD